MNRREFLSLAAAAAVEPEVPWSVAAWPAGFGNHRARVRVTSRTPLAWAHLLWRRHDPSPETKAVWVVDAKTGERVRNVTITSIGREFCDLAFEPRTVPGDYFIYYLPYKADPAPSRYSIQYFPPEPVRRLSEATPVWASVRAFEARTARDRFDPMELIATRTELDRLLARYPGRTLLLFPEDRQHPIRMTDDLPLRWIKAGPSARFHGEAQRGEFFVFQIGAYALSALPDLTVEGNLGAFPVRCFNTAGTDWLGRPMRKSLAIASGKVAPLWFGVEVPATAAPGIYRGEVKLGGENRVELSLNVTSALAEESGDHDLWRHSRLRWLDSTIGLDDEPVKPYTPVEVEGRTHRCLGREVRFGENGLPESIRSNGREILAAPVTFGTGGEEPRLAVRCEARLEYDGYIGAGVRLKALESVSVNDLRLEIPLRRDAAVYMMGLGRKGGYRPGQWQWKWDIKRANNMVWLGDWNAGLHLKLKNTEDTWDIYDLRSAGLPDSWHNSGKGGCTVTEEGDRVVVRAYSGARTLKAGDELLFRFGLLITPVKPLDPAHWSQRYYHACVEPEVAAASGATILNIHHGNELNPFINYPFLTTDALAAYVNSAHQKGLKVKLYYTVRELSTSVAELWALRSLDTEIFTDGPGGGSAWLREHLVSGYQPAWHQVLPDGEVDAAIVTTGLSRWHNYYLEGLAYLLKHAEIDGLYLDGIGYDRAIMQRVRKVMDRTRPGCLIDFHSGNEFPFNDLRISPANKYMEHFPYLSSLWFGEGYDYDESPDYWLVEISGIPFGLFSEMLEKNGNPWRGMIYGMTARYYQGADPKHIWKLWDDFGIEQAEMLGYWSPACPVRTDRKDVLVTVYHRNEKALLSIASWAKQPVSCRLVIDWKALGVPETGATLAAPAIEGFQPEARFTPGDAIPVEPGKGWLLILAAE